MFFYASLFVASLIVALVVHWLYQVIKDAWEVLARTIFLHRQNRAAAGFEAAVGPSAWGRGERANPSQAARTAAIAPADTVPWGWPGHEHNVREQGVREQGPKTTPGYGSVAPAGMVSRQREEVAVGWPYREEKLEMAGKAYKVTRKTAVKKENLSASGKPWGW